jgi:hypothetical protein
MTTTRVFIIQLFTFGVAGAAQLFALSYATNQMSATDSARFMYLVALTTLLSFLDFGILWTLFMNLPKNPSASSQLIRTACRKVMRINLTLALGLLFLFYLSYLSFDVALVISVILVNNFFFIGLVASRVIKGEIFYFVIFNSSWPLTLIVFYLIGLGEIDFHSIFAIVPPTASVVINAFVSAYIYFRQISKTNATYATRLNIDELKAIFRTFSFYAATVQILTLLMLYGDRFFIFPKLTSSDFLNYAICVQFGGMAITIIQNFSSSIIGTHALEKNRLKDTVANGVPVVPLLGLIAGVAYFLLMPTVAQVFFPSLSINLTFLFLIAVNIFVTSISVAIYQNFWINSELRLRVYIQLFGIASYLVFGILILGKQVALWQAGLALMLSNLGIIPYGLHSMRTKNKFKRGFQNDT